MKPTKEIIKLAKKLHELGYRQDIWDGDWYMVKDKDYKSGWSNPKCWHRTERIDEALMDDNSHIPIPSLEDGLNFLRERFEYRVELWGHTRNKEWVCRWNVEPKSWVRGNTPHEVVLKAMVQVLEQ